VSKPIPRKPGQETLTARQLAWLTRKAKYGRLGKANMAAFEARSAKVRDPSVIRERLLSKVEYDTNGGCWLWAYARVGETGYGRLTLPGDKPIGAHKLSWLLFRGDIPAGLSVCHRCDIRICVNPDHLFLGSTAENMADRDAKGRGAKRAGALNTQAKLTPEIVADIRARCARGEMQKALAEQYGVTPSTISDIRHGRSWSGRPGPRHA
jgi:hypothetical protein